MALEYCTQAGIDRSALGPGGEALVQQELSVLQAHIESGFAARVGAGGLYTFSVPKLGEGGACSLFGQLDPAPYDLRALLGAERSSLAELLARTQCLVEAAQAHTGVDWIGVYRRTPRGDGVDVLLKLAYRGSPSRAEFPLTAAFAQHSNNSTVGLSGKARIIQDVVAYAAAGGEYYTCDPAVMAEACLPLFAADGSVCGIVDAETAKKDFFAPQVLAKTIAFTLAAQAIVRTPI